MEITFLLSLVLGIVLSTVFLMGSVGGFLYLVRRARANWIERSGEQVGYEKLADEIDVLRMQNSILSERLGKLEKGPRIGPSDATPRELPGPSERTEPVDAADQPGSRNETSINPE